MIDDIDLWRAARLLVDRYGDAAEIEAAARADERLEAGDMEGRTVWLQIVDAVCELQRGRKPGEAVN